MVALGVGYFVAQYSGDFVRGLRPFDQPGVHVDGSTGNGKCVELVVFNDKKTVFKRQWPRGGENSPADAIDIALGFGIIDKFKIFFCFAAKFTADSSLFVLARCTYRRQDRLARRTATAS